MLLNQQELHALQVVRFQVERGERSEGLPLPAVIFQDEPAEIASWEQIAPKLAAIGMLPLGIDDRIKEPEPTPHIFQNKPYYFRPVKYGEELVIPAAAIERIDQAERMGICLTWYMIAEERVERPKFITLAEKRAREIQQQKLILRDPLLFAIVPTGPDRGGWVFISRWEH